MKIRFSLVPLPYEEFTKLRKDYAIIFNRLYDYNTLLKRCKIIDRIYLIIMINKNLIYVYNNHTPGNYYKIKGDIYFPYLTNENLKPYYDLSYDIGTSVSFFENIFNSEYRNHKYQYKIYNMYRKVEQIKDYISNNWNFENDYDEELKKNSYVFK